MTTLGGSVPAVASQLARSEPVHRTLTGEDVVWGPSSTAGRWPFRCKTAPPHDNNNGDKEINT